MKKSLSIFLILLSFLACTPPEAPKEKVEELKRQIHQIEKTFVEMKREVEELRNRKGRMLHTVYLALEDNVSQADQDSIIAMIERLDELQEVKNLTIGRFKDIGDERSMSDYDIVMQMEFDNMDDYKVYQEHPLHLELRQFVGEFISKKSATHDSILE